MKKIILFLTAITICVSMNKRVMAQTNTQITIEELKNLYDNGEYKKAISYIDQFKKKQDGSALIILGDCSWEEAGVEDAQLSGLINQSLINQSMAISQGLYIDNSFELYLQQQIRQRIINLKLQAIDLYSRASQLGNSLGTQRLGIINAITSSGNPSINNQSFGSSSINSTSTTSFSGGTHRKCGYCEGTGKCPYCNSAGQSKACVENRFGVRCTDTYCIARNHKCKHCDGTHICSNCNGTGHK